MSDKDDNFKPISNVTPNILIEDTDNLTKQVTTTESVYLRQQLATQRKVMEALWSITEYLEGALDKPPKCILRKYWDACTLDDFITAITEVEDE